MNIVTKVFFTCYTYFFYIANTFSPECLELVNFPWYLLYILSSRFTIIAEITTFLCMSISKVILNLRLDIYMRLNSNMTINLASLCVSILILIDMMIRIDMHLYGNCEDRIAIVGYQIEFQRKLCIPESYNSTENITLCEIYNKAEKIYPIGCLKCPSYPTLRILGSAVLIMESIKFVLGFVRIIKKYKKKFKPGKVNPISNSENTKKEQKSKSTSDTNVKVFNVDDSMKGSKDDNCSLEPSKPNTFSSPAIDELNVIEQIQNDPNDADTENMNVNTIVRYSLTKFTTVKHYKKNMNDYDTFLGLKRLLIQLILKMMELKVLQVLLTLIKLK